MRELERLAAARCDRLNDAIRMLLEVSLDLIEVTDEMAKMATADLQETRKLVERLAVQEGGWQP